MHIPALKKGDVDDGREVVDKLQDEEFDCDAVVVFALCAQAFPVSQPEG